MKNYFIPFLLLALFCPSGCGGKKKPADLPHLFPVILTVIQDDKPLEGATVNLVADGVDVRFTTGAITGKDGVATIKTDAYWPGAPAGKYRVIISKIVAPPPDTSDSPPPTDSSEASLKYYEEQQAKAAERNAQTKSLVNSKFLKFGTTPLSVVVTEAGLTETLDVGAAVDELMDKVLGGSSSR